MTPSSSGSVSLSHSLFLSIYRSLSLALSLLSDYDINVGNRPCSLLVSEILVQSELKSLSRSWHIKRLGQKYQENHGGYCDLDGIYCDISSSIWLFPMYMGCLYCCRFLARASHVSTAMNESSRYHLTTSLCRSRWPPWCLFLFHVDHSLWEFTVIHTDAILSPTELVSR